MPQVAFGKGQLNTLANDGDACVLSVDNSSGAGVIVSGSGWSGTLVVKVSNDGKTLFPGAAYPYPTGVGTQSITGNGAYTVPAGNFAFVHVIAQGAITGGTVQVQMNPSQGMPFVLPSAIPQGVIGNPANVVTATNAAAVITYAAAAGFSHGIGGLIFGYTTAPAGGNLQITDNGVAILNQDITAAGPQILYFPPTGLQGSGGKALVITLAGGGGGIVGKLNVLTHWMTPSPGGILGGALDFVQPSNSQLAWMF